VNSAVNFQPSAVDDETDGIGGIAESRPLKADGCVMVERSKRGKGKRRLLGSHQKCWIWGRHVVTETLRAGTWRPVELHLADSLPANVRRSVFQAAETQQIPVRIEASDRLRQLCGSAEHQGLLAKMPEFPYADADELCRQHSPQPLFVLLDGLQDPYNFGAIVRSADAFGVEAVVIPGGGQVGVTSLVTRASAGAVNFVPIARVNNLCEFAPTLKQTGAVIVGTDQSANRPLDACDFRRPVALVIGNEGEGISPEMRRCCDDLVAIPQLGRVGSLNAAVAAGILFYEAARQRAAANPSSERPR